MGPSSVRVCRRAEADLSARVAPAVSLGFGRTIAIDVNLTVAHLCVVRPNGHHAWRCDDLASADVEGAIVEVALDDVAVDFAFRQPPGPVCTCVVDDVISIADSEHGDDEVADRDLQALRIRDLGCWTDDNQ